VTQQQEAEEREKRPMEEKVVEAMVANTNVRAADQVPASRMGA
jgi:hypothetical protein